MKKSLINFLGCLAFLLPAFATAKVWQSNNRWSSSWEARYQSWVSQSWHKNYFNEPGPYQGLKMDCADLVYIMRAVFAAENGLPFAINDPTGSGRLITNEMSRFDSLSENQRKRRFMLYLFDVVSTKSLPRDSYTPAVNRQSLSSGSFLLTDAKSHHSWTVKSFLPTGIPHLLFASRPAKTVMFQRLEYPSMGFTFPNGLNPDNHAGFRNFKSIEDLKKPAWNISGYSLEQYQIPYKSWRKEMQNRMSTRGETAEELLHRLLDSACSGSRERVVAVQEGLNHLKKLDQQGRRCMTQTEYDDYSTPSRDKRLIGNFEDLVDAHAKLKSQGRLGNGKYAQITDATIRGQYTGYCSLKIPGFQYPLSFSDVVLNGLAGALSSNPHDKRDARWGFGEWPGNRARSCPTY